MFYYVYILYSFKDRQFYAGFTTDLEKRIKRHQAGKVISTKDRRPLKLIFYEAYLNKSDALRREKYFKTSKGKTTRRTMLKEYLEELNVDEKNKDEIILVSKKKQLRY